MGKSFGLLHRIFSFSRGSKRSGTNFDLLNTDEHGQDRDIQDPDETLHMTGSARTTGGIGGLGRGITNAASEMSCSNTAATNNKGGENGLRKHLLRRASLSASDLLSWGHDKSAKRVICEGGGQTGFGSPLPSQPYSKKARERSNHPLRTGVEMKHDIRYEGPELGQKNNTPRYNNLIIEGLGLSNEICKHGERGDGALCIHAQENDDLTRLLRTSSANYRVISETDYRDMTPLDHPINAVALNRSTSIPLLSSLNRSNPPTAWPSHLPGTSVAFPSTHVPRNLVHAPSVSSATSTSTYKVTVHRRRIHSRTSFPEANRALDHLHSSSPVTASSTPSASPRSSSDVPEVTFRRNIQVKLSGIPKMREPACVSRGPESPPNHRQSPNGRKEPPPSMLPRRSSKRQPGAQQPTHEEASIRRSVVVNSQLYPVAPLRTVPPISHRSASISLEKDYSKNGQPQSQTDRPSIKLLYSKGGSTSRTSMMESAFRYQTPLKGIDCSVANEEAHDGLIEKTEEIDQQTSPTPSTLTKSSARRTPVKPRNVLKKKRWESQASPVPASEDTSGRAASIKSEKSRDDSEIGHEKTGSSANLRTVLGLLHVVEGVVERLHASAVGEQMLASPRRQRAEERAAEWDVVSVNEVPLTPPVGIPQSNSLPMRHNSRPYAHPYNGKALGLSDLKPITPSKRWPVLVETPRDKARLAKLRRDPSVVSLLDMYQADGTLKRGAFSNTPPTKPLQRTTSERASKAIGRLAIPSEIKASDSNAPRKVDVESRSAQMRRVYVEALDESSLDESLVPTPNGPESHGKLSITASTCVDHPTTVATLTSKTPGGEKPVPSSLPHSAVGIGNLERKTFAKSQPRVTIGLDSSDTRLEFASFSSDNEVSSRAVDVSLFVEPGSIGYFDDTSFESTPNVETPIDGEIWMPRSPVGRYNPEIDREQGGGAANEIPRSPNRRASEIFAFLGLTAGNSDESFEAGATSGREEVSRFSLISPKEHRDFKPQNQSKPMSSQLTPSRSTPTPGSSPSKRPLGPRNAAAFDSRNISATDQQPFTSIQPSATEFKSSTYTRTSSVAPGEPDSPVPLTTATFASDSFASQNTTDRSLYRGIYKYLNETTSNASRNEVTPTVEGSDGDLLLQPSLGDERNPFLTKPFDFDKSLPIMPRSEDDPGELRRNQRAGDFVPLPIFSPISPLAASITSKNFPEDSQFPMPPSPCNPKGSVKERVAMWESTKPLEIDKGSVQRQSSKPRYLAQEGKSVRWSEDISGVKKSGLGDGRAFNIPHVVGRMYGPRAPSPAKKFANRAKPERVSSPSTKGTKSIDLNQNYPFSQDLFPAILSPSGPAVVKPTSLLQTPQNLSALNDPSPASSSKLGVYGREIMALARSKSSGRGGHDATKPL